MHLTDKALFLSSSLVFIAIIFSYKEKINLEKDIIIGALRAVVQLLVVGYFLSYIFSIDSFIFTTIILLFMIFNASRTSAKKAKYIKNIQSIHSLRQFYNPCYTHTYRCLSLYSKSDNTCSRYDNKQFHGGFKSSF